MNILELYAAKLWFHFYYFSKYFDNVHKVSAWQELNDVFILFAITHCFFFWLLASTFCWK